MSDVRAALENAPSNKKRCRFQVPPEEKQLKAAKCENSGSVGTWPQREHRNGLINSITASSSRDAAQWGRSTGKSLSLIPSLLVKRRRSASSARNCPDAHWGLRASVGHFQGHMHGPVPAPASRGVLWYEYWAALLDLNGFFCFTLKQQFLSRINAIKRVKKVENDLISLPICV